MLVLSHSHSRANTLGQHEGVTKTFNVFLNGKMKTVAAEAENNPFYGPQKSEVTIDGEPLARLDVFDGGWTVCLHVPLKIVPHETTSNDELIRFGTAVWLL